MEKEQIKIDLPPDILADHNISKKSAAERMFYLFVLDLYKHKQISSGKAAELLGIHKYDFIRFLEKEGLYYFNYSEDEMEREFRLIDQWNDR